jgi:tetratricopeptide (TPR) repeat protein
MRAALLVLLTVALLVLPACQMNERLSGTVIGGVGGGAIGAAAGGVGGAVVGILAGGIAGYLVGDYIADQRERGRTQVFQTGGTTAQVAPQVAPQAGTWGGESRPRGRVAGIKVRAVDERARAAYERGRHALTAPEARVYFEQAIRLDPSRPAPYNALALNALYRGDRAEAERDFRKALQVDPGYYPARYNLQRLQRQTAR